MGAKVSKWISSIDADDIFAFTTPRMVQIKDRRLGILSLLIQGAIAGYIIGYVLIFQKSYRLPYPAKGTTRIDNYYPVTEIMHAPMHAHPYCNMTLPLNGSDGNTTYQTPTMHVPFKQARCLRFGQDAIGGILYPTDELNAIFMATRVRKVSNDYPDGCSPDVDDNCFLDEEFPVVSDQYLVATEMYPLFFEHTMDTRELGIFRQADGMVSKGLIGKDGNLVDSCAPFIRRGIECQPAVADHNDSYVIESLLEAAGVPGGSLDSPLKPEAQPGDDDYGVTYRAAGIMLVVEIVYEGEVDIHGKAENLAYTYHASFIPGANYIQYRFKNVGPGKYIETDTNGVRIAVRQTGVVYKFEFQVLLLNLASSVALLAIASTAVKFLAFKLLPNRFIYRQYATAKTIKFKVLTKSQRDIFKQADIINQLPDPARLSVVADKIRPPHEQPHSTPYDAAKTAARKASFNLSARDRDRVQPVRNSTSVHPEPELGDSLSDSTVEASDPRDDGLGGSKRQVQLDLSTT